MWARLMRLLQAAADDPRFPPTLLYNENWMLRLVLDWLVGGGASSLMHVAPGANWYSEALLRSAFPPRFRGDPLAESYTRADGVIGHFRLAGNGTGELELLRQARQLTVVEGKMFSKLSAGVSNARYFDQAARSVACMAETLCTVRRKPDEMDDLRFYLAAPRHQIESGVFGDLLTLESIEAKVRRRAAEYEGARDGWLEHWFLPVLCRVEVGMVS